MSRKRRAVEIYAPAGFKATWRKFLEICKRDGVSASHLVRVWVEGYVARKDPGNPQRPITAFVEGHDDELTARRSDLVKHLLVEADKRGGYLNYSLVVQAYRERHHLPGFRLVAMAKSMCQDLAKLGVKIVY